MLHYVLLSLIHDKSTANANGLQEIIKVFVSSYYTVHNNEL